MTDIDPPMESIIDPSRYEHLLSAFELTEEEKADLIQVLYCIAVEAIEMDIDTVDKTTKTLLTKGFNRSNLL